MTFEEDGCLAFNPRDTHYVYFLLSGDEVVYVGKTASGLGRAFYHKDKEHDGIRIMKCTPCDIDRLENKYILKYRPKYNREPNYSESISLKRVKKMARMMAVDDFGLSYRMAELINVKVIKSIMRDLDVEPFTFNSATYVCREDAKRISEAAICAISTR